MPTKTKHHVAIGMNAVEVIARLVELHPQIRSLLFKFSIPTPTLTDVEEGLKNQPALWLERATHHKIEPAEKFFVLKCEHLTWLTLDNLNRRISGHHKALNVFSAINPGHGQKPLHIPMMDMCCPVNSQNLAILQTFFKNLGWPGLILESGRSYHYYGLKLVSPKALMKFLGGMPAAERPG